MKTLEELSNQMFKDDFTTKAREIGTVPLTAEHLANVASRLKRETGHFLVMEANYIPDDCYGIIYLRPEDARRLNSPHPREE